MSICQYVTMQYASYHNHKLIMISEIRSANTAGRTLSANTANHVQQTSSAEQSEHSSAKKWFGSVRQKQGSVVASFNPIVRKTKVKIIKFL